MHGLVSSNDMNTKLTETQLDQLPSLWLGDLPPCLQYVTDTSQDQPVIPTAIPPLSQPLYDETPTPPSALRSCQWSTRSSVCSVFHWSPTSYWVGRPFPAGWLKPASFNLLIQLPNGRNTDGMHGEKDRWIEHTRRLDSRLAAEAT